VEKICAQNLKRIFKPRPSVNKNSKQKIKNFTRSVVIGSTVIGHKTYYSKFFSVFGTKIVKKKLGEKI